jgi:hypothetical protein
LFARLLAASNPDRDLDEWQVGSVHWTRERHLHWAARYSFQIELNSLRHLGRRHWTLIVAHEIWWSSDRRKAIRNGR